MKKSFHFCSWLLICLAVGGLAGMSVWVSKDNEAVEVTQTTLQGDPAAAQGLTITVHNQMFNQLFWDTKFPAANAAESISEFRFSQKVLNFYEFHDYPPEISMPSFGGGMSSDMGIDLEREDWGNGGILTRPAIDLAKTMGPMRPNPRRCMWQIIIPAIPLCWTTTLDIMETRILRTSGGTGRRHSNAFSASPSLLKFR